MPESLLHYRELAARAVLDVPRFRPSHSTNRGIMICAGGPSYFVQAWVTIKLLRKLGCKLPIELWYRGKAEWTPSMESLMTPLGVDCRDAVETAREVGVERLLGWTMKPFGVLHSQFDEVLYLDSDCVPARDPSYLFEEPSYQNTGSLFWTDRHRGFGSPFLTVRDEAWGAMNVPYREEAECESGQFLVNKQKVWRELNLVLHYNQHADYYYQFLYGDKDTFRMAWHRLGCHFNTIPYGPSSPPGFRVLYHLDHEGQLIFQHRARAKWVIDGENVPIPGFRHYQQCLDYLTELKSSWKQILSELRESGSENERKHRREVIGQRYFRCLVADRLRGTATLNEDGTVRSSIRQLPSHWQVLEQPNGDCLLALMGDRAAPLSLQRHGDGHWSGKRVAGKRESLQLIVGNAKDLSESLQSERITPNRSAGVLQKEVKSGLTDEKSLKNSSTPSPNSLSIAPSAPPNIQSNGSAQHQQPAPDKTSDEKEVEHRERWSGDKASVQGTASPEIWSGDANVVQQEQWSGDLANVKTAAMPEIWSGDPDVAQYGPGHQEQWSGDAANVQATASPEMWSGDADVAQRGIKQQELWSGEAANVTASATQEVWSGDHATVPAVTRDALDWSGDEGDDEIQSSEQSNDSSEGQDPVAEHKTPATGHLAQIKIYGMPRSCTNLMTVLLRQNFHAEVYANRLGWKHGPNLYRQGDRIKGRPLQFVVCVKHPYPWLVSFYHFDVRANNNPASFPEFVRGECRVYGGHNPIDRYNVLNRMWLGLARQSACCQVVQSEMLQRNQAGQLRWLKRQLRLAPKANHIRTEERRVGPDEQIRNRRFDHRYYREGRFMKYYDDALIQEVNEGLDLKLMDQLNYKVKQGVHS